MKKLRVYKYPLAGQLNLPVGATLVKVGNQGLASYAWFKVDATAKVEARQFRIVGTGEDWDNSEWEHRWTWLADPFVWHLIEKVK